MWEIENNPDILALDKDPAAEDFLCVAFEIEKPGAKSNETNIEGTLEKPIDVENTEINDVEGIMNLEECEWNEIFTIEEQESHSTPLPAVSTVIIPDTPPVNHSIGSDKAASIIFEDLTGSPTKTCEDELYLSAQNSNCRVVLEKLSLTAINRLIQSNFSMGLLEDLTVRKSSKKHSLNKSKTTINSPLENAKVINKSEPAIPVDQKKSSNPKRSMSTINKNTVSRVIDAISLDSDDNQSCIIVTDVKNKTDSKKKLKEKNENIDCDIKLQLKLPKTSIAFVKSISEMDRLKKVASMKSRLMKLKMDHSKSLKKNEFVNKNSTDKPLTFENLFNTKLSILGSGFKIGKKVKSTKNEDEFEENDSKEKCVDNNNWASSEKKAFVNEDEEEEEWSWPKEKDQYNDGNNAPKKSEVSDNNNNNGNDDADYGGGFDDGDDDDDCNWPQEKNIDYDQEANNSRTEKSKSVSISNGFVDEDKDEDEEESSGKWYVNKNKDDFDEEMSSSSKPKSLEGRNDPWINYLSKKKIKSEVEDESGAIVIDSQLDNAIEIMDELDKIDSSVNVKEEPRKNQSRSSGNVWSHIQEFQNQYGRHKEDFVDYDETVRTMTYIKDAKWLNSTNEDFLEDSSTHNNLGYCESIDYDEYSNNKWFSNDNRQSPTHLDDDFNNNDRKMRKNTDGGNYHHNNNKNPRKRPESWVDSTPQKSFKPSFRPNNPNTNHHRSNGFSDRNSTTDDNTTWSQRRNKVQRNIPPNKFTMNQKQMEQLFPPFKKEYFNNKTGCSDQSMDTQGWHRNYASNYHTDGSPVINQTRGMQAPHPLYHNQQFFGDDDYQYNYHFANNTNNTDKKESYQNGLSDAYFYYGHPSMGNPGDYLYPYYGTNDIPITPASPDAVTTAADDGDTGTGKDNGTPDNSTTGTPSLAQSQSLQSQYRQPHYFPDSSMSPYYYCYPHPNQSIYGAPYAPNSAHFYRPPLPQFQKVPPISRPDPNCFTPASPDQEAQHVDSPDTGP